MDTDNKQIHARMHIHTKTAWVSHTRALRHWRTKFVP